jgi:helix-turn-helix protein
MSVHFTSPVWKNSPQTGSTLLILLALADMANDEGFCWPSIKTLAERARMQPRNVQVILQKLIVAGELDVQYGNGPKTPNGYLNRYRVICLPATQGVHDNAPVQRDAPVQKSTGGVHENAPGGVQKTARGVHPSAPKTSEKPSGLEPSEKPSKESRSAPNVNDPLIALLAAYREVMHPGEPPFVQTQFLASRQFLAALQSEGVTPERYAEATRAAAASWPSERITARSVAGHVSDLLRPKSAAPTLFTSPQTPKEAKAEREEAAIRAALLRRGLSEPPAPPSMKNVTPPNYENTRHVNGIER